MHDVLIHSGVRFRRDSISVLCEPTFRDTLLREVLTSTTTIDGGRPLAVQGADLEALVSARSDALDDAGTSDDVGGTRSHVHTTIPAGTRCRFAHIANVTYTHAT